MLSLVNTLKNYAYIDYDGLTSRIRSIVLKYLHVWYCYAFHLLWDNRHGALLKLHFTS